jgi:ADP-ribose pyrophosphatase
MNRQIVSDELVYEGHVVEVHAVTLRQGDGELIRRELLRYPGAVVILPILDDGRVVLICNQRYAVDEALLELPAGGIDPGELPAQAAARELTEETGYTAARLEKLGTFVTAPGTSDEVMHAFVARDLQAGRQQLQGYESIEVRLHSFGQVREMIRDGRLHDGKTIAAMGQYWLAVDQVAGPGQDQEG